MGVGAARLLGTLSTAAAHSSGHSPASKGRVPFRPSPHADDTHPALGSEPADAGQTVPCQTRVRLSDPCQTSRLWGSHFTSLVGR